MDRYSHHLVLIVTVIIQYYSNPLSLMQQKKQILLGHVHGSMT